MFILYIRVEIKTPMETIIYTIINGFLQFLLQNYFQFVKQAWMQKEINQEGRPRSPTAFDTQLDLYNSHLLGQHVQTEWHIWHADGTAAKLWCNWCTTVAQCGPAASGDTFPRQRAASSGLAGACGRSRAP